MASLMVIAYHFGPHIVRTESPFSILHRLPQLTWAGVDLFFVLSGFLIASILLASRQSPDYFKVFYMRRAFRIFPLYYIVLLSYVGAATFLGSRSAELGRLFENPLPSWTYFLYLQNFAMTAAAGFGAIWLAGTWSLAVEEQFYATLPIMIRKLNPRVLAWMVATTFIAAIVLRGAIQKFRFVDSMATYVLLPTRVDSLATGVLIALIVRHSYGWNLKRVRWIQLAIVSYLVVWIGYEFIPNPQAIRLGFIVHSGNALAFGGILWSVLVSPHARFSRLLSTRSMRQLGNMAYSMYLFHPIFLCIAFRMIKGYDPLLQHAGDLLPIVAALIATLALSFLSWRFLEKPLVAIGHRYKY